MPRLQQSNLPRPIPEQVYRHLSEAESESHMRICTWVLGHLAPWFFPRILATGFLLWDARWNSEEGEALECNLAVRKFNISHNHATIGAAITEIMVEFGLVDKAIDNVVKESSEVEEDENGLAEADAEVEAVVAAVAAVALA